MQSGIRVAHSVAAESRAAVQEFHAAVAQPDASLVIFFCSNTYDLEQLAQEINRLFSGVAVIGCTTAGEIGPAGYCESSLVGASFSAEVCTAVTGHIGELQQFEMSKGLDLGLRLVRELEDRTAQTDIENGFAISLIDGLSVREEPVARAFQKGLGALPLVGGSAGDGLGFSATHIFADGAFRRDSAALAVLATPLPFHLFKTQHFVPTDRRLVITEADASRRVVKEIDGLPAAQEYARLLEVEISELHPGLFAASPMVVLIDGNNYVRSIQKINADGSITFFCAIEEGVVLRVARGVDLVENLEEAFAEVRKEIGQPELVLGFDCILRRLEILQAGLGPRIESIFNNNRAIGFNTYGEQFRGIHINQTLTGVALGAASPRVPFA